MKLCLSSWIFVDEEFLMLAKRAGVSMISFGIESIVPEVQAFYNKMISKTQIR